MTPEQEQYLTNSDPLLHRFFQATSETDAIRERNALCDQYILPIADAVLKERRGFSAGDTRYRLQREFEAMLDIKSLVAERMLKRLDLLRSDMHEQIFEHRPIQQFEAYCVVVAANAWNHYLTRKHPERMRLEHRLRYALETDALLMLWAEPKGISMYCGRREWQLEQRAPSRLDWEALDLESARRLRPRNARTGLRWLFERVFAPLRFGDVLAFFLEFWPLDRVESNIKEPAPFEARLEQALLSDSDAGKNPQEIVAKWEEVREWHRRLWPELLLLPANQRYVLLFTKVEENQNVAQALLASEVVSTDQLAEALAVSREEVLERLRSGPESDAKIAERLDIDVRYVPVLRMRARGRLRQILEAAQ